MVLRRSIFASAAVFPLLFSHGALAAQATGSGTGFLIAKEGWVVTNAHVVDGCDYVEVSSFGKAAEIQSDKQNDLAVLRLPTVPADIQPLKLRNAQPKLGEDVAALGYPLAKLLSDSIKITMGNINSLIGLENDTRYLQISTPIQPGNSGGPLVDRSGFLLGINSAKLDDSYAIKTSGSIPQNVNFAIKSNILELFLQSRSINFTKEDAAASELSSADLAEKVSKSVFQIVCYSNELPKAVASAPPPPPPAVEQQTPSPTYRDTSSSRLNSLAAEYVKLLISSNSDGRTALSVANDAYANYVDYFGKTTTHREVLADKKRYYDRWPIRTSQVRDYTVEVFCENNKCAVTGEYDWFVSSPKRNKKAAGTASFYYVLDMQGGIKVISEGGKARK
ncbi:trypsin-like peptidase domain-containing protein [Brucella pecoris]|uniref:Trypsin-like peptidase domain-containing protein n=1 Tax=Brucella pecoris TaxID=867683 RepID=A0A5C5CNB4_9HYPH|nr:trypsin-like peptidase domain-containing protein [Brucella pecoris]